MDTMASKVALQRPVADHKRPPRVAMVIQQFHPIVGGAERQAQLLGASLVRQGIPVTLYTARWDDSLPRRERINGIDVRRLGVLSAGRGVRTGAGITFMLRLFWELVRNASSYDIIHIHQALKPAVAAVAAAVWVRKPTIIKVGCGGDWNDIGLLRKLRLGPIPVGQWMVAVLHRCARIVALNGSIAHDLVKEGFRGGQIREIPNGVNLPRLKSKRLSRSASVHFLFVGRLEHQKGLDVLFEALRRLPKKSDWNLSVVGAGEERKAYETMARDLGLQSRVKFLGLVQNVPELLATAGIFVLPSRAEGMSNALLEAMSMGVACIATDIGGNAELVEDGVTGLLVPTDDPEKLSHGLRKLLTSSPLRRKLGSAARKRIMSDYTIEAITRKYRSEYSSMLNTKKTDGPRKVS